MQTLEKYTVDDHGDILATVVVDKEVQYVVRVRLDDNVWLFDHDPALTIFLHTTPLHVPPYDARILLNDLEKLIEV